MNKIYTRINWENYPSEATALNETNLNKMDFALNEVDNRLIEQDTTKLSKTDASNDVVNWTMDENTGVITVTRRSGEQILFDLNIEKIPVSFSLSDDGILTMVTDDGTTFTANIGAMIPILTFNDSDEIAVSVSGTGINKTYSFSVKDNSITENKLQPNFLADIKVQSASASLGASNAEINATKSQSYAVGGTGTRGENEDTDNAKYYNEQAQKALSEMQKSQVTGVKGNNETNFRTGNVNLTSDDVGSVAVGGDAAENTVTYESSDVGPDGVPSLISLEKFTTGEKLSSLIKKTSIIANNFRYFLKMLGTNDISAIGDGTVTGGLVSLNDSLNTRLNFRVTNVLSNGANTNRTTNHVACTDAFTVNSPIATSNAIAIVIVPLKFSTADYQGQLGIKVGSKKYYGKNGDSGIITFADGAYVPVVEVVSGITLAQGNNTCYGLIHSDNAVKTIYSLISNSFRVLWIIQ